MAWRIFTKTKTTLGGRMKTKHVKPKSFTKFYPRVCYTYPGTSCTHVRSSEPSPVEVCPAHAQPVQVKSPTGIWNNHGSTCDKIKQIEIHNIFVYRLKQLVLHFFPFTNPSLWIAQGCSASISCDTTAPKCTIMRLAAPLSFFCPIAGYAEFCFCSVDPKNKIDLARDPFGIPAHVRSKKKTFGVHLIFN